VKCDEGFGIAVLMRRLEKPNTYRGKVEKEFSTLTGIGTAEGGRRITGVLAESLYHPIKAKDGGDSSVHCGIWS